MSPGQKQSCQTGCTLSVLMDFLLTYFQYTLMYHKGVALWSTTRVHLGSFILSHIHKQHSNFFKFLVFVLFADGTKFIKSIASFSVTLQFQEDINSLIKWVQILELFLNYQICVSVSFSLSQMDHSSCICWKPVRSLK